MENDEIRGDIEQPAQVPPQEPADPGQNDPAEADVVDDIDFAADKDEPGDKTEDHEVLGPSEQEAALNPTVGEGTPDRAPFRQPSEFPPGAEEEIRGDF